MIRVKIMVIIIIGVQIKASKIIGILVLLTICNKNNKRNNNNKYLIKNAYFA